MEKLLASAVLICLSCMAFAHPPKDVILSYDSVTQMISVTVVHPLKESRLADPTKHFVKDITLTVNDNKMIVEALFTQQSDDGEKSVYLLNVKKGDKVKVMANCSLAGSKTSEITIK
jgi:hypothetical protein